MLPTIHPKPCEVGANIAPLCIEEESEAQVKELAGGHPANLGAESYSNPAGSTPDLEHIRSHELR